MKRRLTAILLAVLVLNAALPAVSAAEEAEEMTRKTTFHTSAAPDNDICFTVEGRRMKVEGCLNYEELTSIWIQTADRAVSQIFSAAQGVPFSATVDLEKLTGRDELRIYIQQTGGGSYWSYLWQNLYINTDGTDCWIEQNTQALENNAAKRAQWINPGENVGRAVSQEVQALSDQLVGDETDDYQKTWLIYSWVIRNIYYNFDYYYNKTSPIVYNADGILESRTSVCAGYTNLFQALLDAQGIPNIQVSTYSLGLSTSGHYDGDLSSIVSNHAHNEVFLDGRWVMIDSTWDSNNKYYGGDDYRTAEPTGHLYFDISDECLAVNHYIVSRPAAAEQNTPDDWAKEEVWSAIGEGLVPDDLQSAYRENITREEFCRMVVALVERKVGMAAGDYLAALGKTVTAPFADTDNAAVLAAYALGIVNGRDATTFDPDGSISRQEAATMLMRAGKVLGVTSGEGLAFADADRFASWAEEGIAYVSGLAVPGTGNRVMKGVSDTQFDPEGTYTREQACLTVHRLLCAAGD